MMIQCMSLTLRLNREMLANNLLTEDTFLKYAMRIYDNPTCKNVQEFEEDLNRVKYVKRLLNKYNEKGILRSRLLLNHTITLTNVFTSNGAARILFYKLERNLHPGLKSVLLFLNSIPDTLPEVNLKEIPHDVKLLKLLGEDE
mgnify:CR=1 FL=1